MAQSTPNANRDWQITEHQLERFADECRKDIGDWIHRAAPTGRGSTMVWRGELAKMVVRHTVLKTGEWREVMLSAEPELQKKYPHLAGDIHHTIKQYLVRSPMEAFLKANAYKWLQYLEHVTPALSKWYPHLAIQVAHKVFRLKGRIDTFRRYLNHPARRRRLPSLRIPTEGLC